MNKYRLHSTVFERKKDEEIREPKKVFFISVEGNETEKEYFEGVSDYKAELGIDALVNIELLRKYKSDTYSAPEHVLELLEEYIELRKSNYSGNGLENDIPSEIVDKFGTDTITAYINEPELIDIKVRKCIDNELRKLSYDVNYRKYLKKYNNPNDKFAIIIDRDCGSHSVEEMNNCIEHCRKKGYDCYISNPCFEFWLLLHILDVENELNLEDLKENRKISNKHTFVSLKLSELANHGKSNIKFKINYKDNINTAVQRAKSRTFASSNYELVKNVGTNIWQLIEEMQQPCR